MAGIKIVETIDEAFEVIREFKAEGFNENEINVISNAPLHSKELNETEVKQNSTGSFSDKMAKLFTGEDTESTLLHRYPLSEHEVERYKQELLHDNILVIAYQYPHECEEFEKANAAFENDDATSK